MRTKTKRSALLLTALLGARCGEITETQPEVATVDSLAFDYQERTGFPLAYDDREVSLDALDAEIQGSLLIAGQTLLDWQLIHDRLISGAHGQRQRARMVRVYTDQPVYLYGGFALLPDPTRPDDPVDLSSWNLTVDCLPSPDNPKATRCISLHRDHVQNRRVTALFIAARTIIVRGENATGGLSLVTVTENLHMTWSDSIDLSARQDPAPTLGMNQHYSVFTDLIGSPSNPPVPIDGAAYLFAIGAAPNWAWINLLPWLDPGVEPNADLQWQFDRARLLVPDYDWSTGDPCADTPTDDCLRRREPRGFAGLEGGSWFGLTYRTTMIGARSFGQPGGNGGTGLAAPKPIVCGAVPQNYHQDCQMLPAGCDDPECGNPNAPPGAGDHCVCIETCAQSSCSVHYAEEDATGECAVTCGISSLAKGQRGGQAGPGGRGGIVRISAVTREGPCADWPESKLADPAQLHALDERCLDGRDNDGAPGSPIDCESKLCSDDPNVTVCDTVGGQNNVTFVGWQAAQNFLDGVIDQIPPGPDPSPSPELQLINPVWQPQVSSSGLMLLDLGGGVFLEVAASGDAPAVPASGALWEAPSWAPRSFLELPTSSLDGSLRPPPLDMVPLQGPDESLDDATLSALIARDASGQSTRGEDPRAVEARTRWALYVQAIHGELAAANPGAEIGWAAAIWVAHYVVHPDVRADLDQRQNFVLLRSGRTSTPVMVMRSKSGSLKMSFPITLVATPQQDALCSDALSSSFAIAGGTPGLPGPGGPGTEQLCSGWNPTIGWLCLAGAASDCVDEGDETYPPPITCSIDNCYPRYRFPTKSMGGWTCDPGYSLIPNFSPGMCPGRIQGGGVECESPQGAMGAYLFSQLSTPKSLVRAWPKAAFALALHRLQPLELQRRDGRANTFFKRGKMLGAAARYLSTRNYLSHNLFVISPLCLNPPCFVCPEDVSTTPDELKILCALDQEMNVRLSRIEHDENYYGYPRNYVPPVSMQTSDPLATIDLVSLVQDELAEAKQARDFWMTYGAILESQYYAQVSDATLFVANELLAIEDTIDANGTLTLELQLADQRVHDAEAEVQIIKQTISTLQGLKSQLQTSKGSGLFDIDKIAEVALVAAATYFGGPLAGALAKGAWEQSQAYDEEQKTGAADISKSAAGTTVDAVDSKLDSDWADGAANSFLEKVGGSLGDPLLDELLRVLGQNGSDAKTTLGQVILDAFVAEQAVEAFRAGARLGQAIAERRMVNQKVLEAQRRKAQLQASAYTLSTVQAAGIGIPVEVQYQVAELSLLSAATRVDRAGEYFFLLRRGVERDAVPIDPTTGESTLTAAETSYLLTDPLCQDSNLTSASLDVNLISLDCFDSRTDFLAAYEAGIVRQTDFIDMQDATIPVAEWVLVTDASGEQSYRFDLEITLDAAHRGLRAGQTKQKIDDITFFLETNDPVPAVLPIRIRRPSLAKDVYWLGQDSYVSFGLAKSTPSGPGDLLYYLLNDPSAYERNAFACNALDETSALTGNLELCALSNLDQTSLNRAYLEGHSLLGSLEIRIPVAGLGGRVPSQLSAYVRYTHQP